MGMLMKCLDAMYPQSFNRYAYTQNDPVNFVDPSGLCFARLAITTSHNVDTGVSTITHIELLGIFGCDGSGGSGGGRSRQLQPRDPIRDGGGGGGTEPAPQAGQTNQQPEKVNCTVEVRARRVEGSSGNKNTNIKRLGFHAYILTTQSNQNFSMIYHAAPNNVSNNTLIAEGNRYIPELRIAQADYQTGNDFVSRSGVREGSCDELNNSFQGTVNAVNSSNVPYNTYPLTTYANSTNSNAFVFTALQRGGLNPGYFGDSLSSQMGRSGVFPGWGVTLPLR